MSFARNSTYGRLLMGVFLVGIVLRVCLSLVNSEANDDHLIVAEIIEQEGTLPTDDDWIECFQPKLYHVTVAAILKFIPLKTRNIRVRIAQLVNCVAGIITMAIAHAFLAKRRLAAKHRLLCFSLIALNPKLIGINAQATNDTFVILFCSLTIYFTYLFLELGRHRDFGCVTVCAILAGLSKGNGLVMLPWIIVVLLAKLLVSKGSSPKLRRNYALYLVSFLFAYFVVVSPLGQYVYKYQRYGTPFMHPMSDGPMPHLFRKTYVRRPGVTSFVDSYLSFRFLDLMRNPTVTNERDSYPLLKPQGTK